MAGEPMPGMPAGRSFGEVAVPAQRQPRDEHRAEVVLPARRTPRDGRRGEVVLRYARLTGRGRPTFCVSWGSTPQRSRAGIRRWND